MIDTVDRALQELQAALFARELYSADHLAVVTRSRNAKQLLDEVLSDERRLTVVRFDDHVVFRDRRLPSSAGLGEGLFQRLEQLGVDCLTFDEGVSADEIEMLLEILSSPQPGDERIGRLTRISFGHVDSIRNAEGGAGARSGVPTPGEQVSSLSRIWTGLWDGQGCNADVLSTIVNSICETVTFDRATLLPLASLKDHDEYTFVHTINVGILSAALAEAVGLDANLVRDLTAAALLHDVGKRSIPTEILNKNGKLSDDELRTVQRHPQEGARILFSTPGLPALAPIVAFEHHMQLDGSGYPHALPGWKLSPASQIVQVADIFDALRTHRPYRAALSLDESLEIMRKQAFDPNLFNLFLDRVLLRTTADESEPPLAPEPKDDQVPDEEDRKAA